TVPQREPEAEQQVVVAKPADPVLTPAVGAAARMIVREIFPGIAVFAVILAHRAPLALAEIRSPSSPMLAVSYLLEAQPLGGAKCAVGTLYHQLSSLKSLLSPRLRSGCGVLST